MKIFLLSIIFVVTTTIGYTDGNSNCQVEAHQNLLKCLEALNIDSNLVTLPVTKEAVEITCSDSFPTLQCIEKAMMCSEYKKTLSYFRMSVKSTRKSFTELCKRKNEYIKDISCLKQSLQNITNSDSITEIAQQKSLQKLVKKDITEAEYFQIMCPIWNGEIGLLTSILNCPKDFTDIIREMQVNLISDKCGCEIQKNITSNQCSENGSLRVTFKGGLMYSSFMFIFIIQLLQSA
ncbi:hypothetical protein Ahia01_001172300 [Argonauta hians]